MPRKKKQKEKAPTEDFELYFTDVTMVETEGKYKDVKRLMEDVEIGSHDWCIRTSLTIAGQFGESNMTLNLLHDGSVYIVGYGNYGPDMHYNIDIRCISVWCEKNGWKTPQPSPDVVRDNMRFWKYMWESMLVNSDFLEQRFGKRRSEDMRLAIAERQKDEEDENPEQDEE